MMRISLKTFASLTVPEKLQKPGAGADVHLGYELYRLPEEK